MPASVPREASQLAAGLFAGDRRALARAITLAETGGRAARELIGEIFAHTGRAHVIGVTGAPGVGKSTLVDRLAMEYRRAGKSVGIVAVDPSSPFTGGAVLGDRIRMYLGASDPEVFIRSLASRGHLGGLSVATDDVVRLMDAAGLEVVIVETVGAGQSEVEVMEVAHSTTVVLAPGLGDDIQAIKAGILEIGDVFVVNKADRDGADRTAMELEVMLDLGGERPWRPPVLKVVAREGQGVAEVTAAIGAHAEYLRSSGRWSDLERRRAASKVREVVTARVSLEVFESRRFGTDRLVEQVANREIDPYSAADEILRAYRAGGPDHQRAGGEEG